MTALVANPLWVVKTRMCTTTRYTSDGYKGLIDGLKRLYGEEGIKGLYRGLVPALFGVSHGAIQFMVYEEMKKRRNELRQQKGIISHDELNAKLNQTEYLVMAVTSKVIAAVSTYPYQVLKSRLQVIDPVNRNRPLISLSIESSHQRYIQGRNRPWEKDDRIRRPCWIL